MRTAQRHARSPAGFPAGRAFAWQPDGNFNTRTAADGLFRFRHRQHHTPDHATRLGERATTPCAGRAEHDPLDTAQVRSYTTRQVRTAPRTRKPCFLV
ncbi:hypothetical protein BCEP4_110012 [Burkholderia cepacia]|nr:hypothetical protein BCEP4_110012 [Burkholderia cepacia]